MATIGIMAAVSAPARHQARRGILGRVRLRDGLTPPLLATLLALAACGGEPAPGPAAASAPALATGVIQPVAVPTERLLDGSVEAVDEATISAQTAGRVAEILYDVNDRVPAGAVILRLQGTEQRASLQQAEAALREAQAREAEAGSRYGRIRDMYRRKVVAKAQYDQALAERDSTVARRAAAEAALTTAREGVAYTEIRAPYAGIVTARLVSVGESVTPGTPLMRGFSTEKLRVTVDVPQSLVSQVRGPARAVVYVDGRRIEASAVTVFPEADAATNTFRTRVELPPATAGLYPGMFVKVGFVTGESPRLLVPQTAVIHRSEVTAVYVVAADGRIAMRQVRLGAAFGDRIEVLAGIAPGERLALDPLAALRVLGNPGTPRDE
jgi:RND family efflux transporter MFP subunit